NHLDSHLISEKEIHELGIPVEIWSILNASINLSRRFAYRNADAIIKVIDRDQAATVQAHPYSLTHGIAEIIANALAYSPDNAEVVISQWQADHSVWISILDTGAGIAPDQIDYAMREFEQIDREKWEQQGLGLGLPLANRIIEAHGGDLKLSSIVGKGTQVVIRLPSLEGTF
ncbi:MAG: ATP-binding protein, partial [Chloroflexota bacterium]